MDCEELVTLKDSIAVGAARCQTRRCKPCHNGRRALRSWYQKAGRISEWEGMTVEQRREQVRRNKDKGVGKGQRRQVVIVEKAQCVDSVSLKHEKPFLTKKQFLV